MPPPQKNILILNLKWSNSSHSERHFCSLATYIVQAKTLLLAANDGHMSPPPGYVTVA